MSLLWIDGFEGYGVTTGSAPSPTGVLARRYTVGTESSTDVEVGRFGGYCLELEGASYIRTPALTTDPILIVGLAIKIPSSDSTLITLLSGGSTGMNVALLGGELVVSRNITTLDTTVGLGLVAGNWYWIEFKVVTHDTTGSYELRVGGVNVLSDSSIDTKPGATVYHEAVRLEDCTVDDLYVCDSTGATNNDFLGNCKVVAIRPDGAGTTTNFTPSSGSNYACMDEVTCNDDTDYVEGDTTDYLDLYTYEDVSDLGTIYGLQINTMCRETDASSFSLKTTIRSNSTNYDDSAQAIGTTSYVNRKRIAETDPDTATNWTMSGINSAEFGIKVG